MEQDRRLVEAGDDADAARPARRAKIVSGCVGQASVPARPGRRPRGRGTALAELEAGPPLRLDAALPRLEAEVERRPAKMPVTSRGSTRIDVGRREAAAVQLVAQLQQVAPGATPRRGRARGAQPGLRARP
ncbi:MAG: hypothetical protein MZV64_13940 [Ignavibacteriales bacterium]|nr:hypothetical protein [Ignavibacteriales bacterium]